jgi:GAF domain-containing protein
MTAHQARRATSSLGFAARRLALVALPTRISAKRVVAIGVSAAILAVGARLVLSETFDSVLVFATFYPAVALAAWAGGFWAGMIATAVSCGILGIFILEPFGRIALSNLGALSIFAGSSAFISGLGSDRRRSIEATEKAHRGSAVLADASRVLQEGVDPIRTIEALADVIVPGFADWCVVDLHTVTITPVVRMAHRDPLRLHGLYGFRKVDPVDWSASSGPGRVSRTGEPEIFLPLKNASLDSLPEGTREMLRRLGALSYVCAPIRGLSLTLGALTVGTSDPARPFSRDEAEIAIEVARRAAVSLEHAVLLKTAKARRDELQALLEAVPDAILVARSDGTIRARNRAALDLVGEMDGRTLDDVLDDLSPLPDRPEMKRVGSSSRYVEPKVVDVTGNGESGRVAVLREAPATLTR